MNTTRTAAPSLTCTRCGIAVKRIAPRGSAARYVHVATPDAPHVAELAEQPSTFAAEQIERSIAAARAEQLEPAAWGESAARTALDTAIAANDRPAMLAEARATVAELTDGRALTPLDMLKLGHARRTLAQLKG